MRTTTSTRTTAAKSAASWKCFRYAAIGRTRIHPAKGAQARVCNTFTARKARLADTWLLRSMPPNDWAERRARRRQSLALYIPGVRSNEVLGITAQAPDRRTHRS